MPSLSLWGCGESTPAIPPDVPFSNRSEKGPEVERSERIRPNTTATFSLYVGKRLRIECLASVSRAGIGEAEPWVIRGRNLSATDLASMDGLASAPALELFGSSVFGALAPAPEKSPRINPATSPQALGLEFSASSERFGRYP